MADQLEAIVQRMIDAGESEENIATVIQSYKPMASHEPQEAPKRTWTDTAVDALPTVGGALGGLVGGIGGTVAGMGVGGVPGAVGGAALGGAAGEGFRQAIQTLRGKEAPRETGEALTGVGKEAATQAAAELGGQAVGGALRMAGRGLYRAAALPIQQMTKYGDLITEGIANRVPVSKAGIEKAGRIVTSRQAEKAAAVADADQRVAYATKGILNDAEQKLAPFADSQRLAGLADPSQDFSARATRIEAANGAGMAPSRVETVKGVIDDTLGPAYKKLRAKEALSADERINMELSHAMSRAQESAMPNYREMNKGISDAVGLKKMIERRTGPGGGNQGLENAMTMLGGPAAVPARIAMLPPVLSRAAIASHVIGEHPGVPSNAIRAALLTLLQNKAQQEPDR